MKTLKLSTYLKGALVIFCVITFITNAMVIINANKTRDSFALFSLADRNSREISRLVDALYSVRGDLNYVHNDPNMSHETIDRKHREIQESIARAKEHARIFQGLERSSAETRMSAEEIVKAFNALVARYDGNIQQLENYNNTGFDNGEYERKLSAAIDRYMQQNEAVSLHARTVAAEDRTKAIWTAIAFIIITVFISVFASFWLRKNLFQRLSLTANTLESIGHGELYHDFDPGPRNEIGEMLLALKNMQTSLVDMVSKIQGGSSNITTSAGRIEVGNNDLSSRTEQQAAALQETAASMEELRITVKQNADNARHASQLTVHASDVARKGGEVMTNVIQTMDQITESSRRIADINSVIDSIANQTNILALNAAVEAARAGEQGRGFAVVASEVRNLAKRSSDAAKEISGLISHSVESVNDGAKLVEKAGETIQGIVTSVAQVSDIMNEITSATDEQSTGIDQIAQAINEMDLVTQQNASLVEEVASVSTTMSSQANALKSSVSIFQIREHQEPVRHKIVRPEPKVAHVETPAKPARQPAKEEKAEVHDEWDTF
jgi:methyl-accepting chemotaxis protein-1 (serine sensor receptor)